MHEEIVVPSSHNTHLTLSAAAPPTRRPGVLLDGNMRPQPSLLLAILTAADVSARVGVDVSRPVDQSQWECLQSPGGQGPVEQAIVRVYCSSGRTDPNALDSLKAAKTAGIPLIGGYIFPCVACGDAAAQVRDARAMLDGVNTSAILWLDIERFKWSSNQTSNRAFIASMTDACLAGGRCGVYSSFNSWSAIAGASWDYPKTRGLPLWYPHYDGNPSFSDFKPFGGWTSPLMKQYLGNEESCGVGVDYNYFPSSSSSSSSMVLRPLSFVHSDRAK